MAARARFRLTLISLPVLILLISRATAQDGVVNPTAAEVHRLTAAAEFEESHGRFDEARVLLQKALELRTELHGERYWKVTDARLALADLGLRSAMTEEQRAGLEEALDLNRQVVDLWRAGRSREAVPLARRVVEIRRARLGEEHRATAFGRYNLAVQLAATGSLAEAEPLFRRARRTFEVTLGREHPRTAMVLGHLAGLLRSRGSFAEAEDLYRESLAVREKTLGENHPSYASTLTDLAGLYLDRGEYAKAEPLYRRALELREKVHGEEGATYAAALNNLALVYKSMGAFARAEPLYRKALEIRLRVREEVHPDTAESLNGLALLYKIQGEFAKAEPLYRRTLEIRKKTLGKDHPRYAETLNNLATLHARKGEWVKAMPLYRRAMMIQKAALGEDSPDYATTLTNLARLYARLESWNRAEVLYQEALGIWTKVLGEGHPSRAVCLRKLAGLYYEKGEPEKAEPLYREALKINRRVLETTAAVLSERQQMQMAALFLGTLNSYLAAAPRAGVEADLEYAQVLPWKGAVLARQSLGRATSASPELSTLFAAYRRTSSRLASLSFRVPTSESRKHWLRRMGELTEEKENLERRLSGLSAAFRDLRGASRITPEALRKLLPPDAALVDFLAYTRGKRTRTGWTVKRRYERHLRAYVMRPGAKVQRVDLGPEKAIAEAIQAWRREFAPTAGERLRDLVWGPIRPHLTDSRTVLVSPDGALGRLSFPALPGSKPGTRLIEEIAIAVIPVPQLLPLLLSAEPPSVGASLLLVGDVDYGGAPGQPRAEVARRAAGLGAGVLPTFDRLANTRGEILAIRDSFELRFPEGKVAALRRGAATEQALCERAGHHRWLHVATHGFFAPPSLRSALAPDDREAERSHGLGRKGVGGMHPGLLSGLALAGANLPPAEGRDDGILTALEVASLDLTGVEVAVLSACETGLGEVAAGEGVLGLQRAFQVAGARTTVTSLWKVPDAATSLLMTRFYENLWEKGMGKLEALRQAQLWMLREGRARGVRVAGRTDTAEDDRLSPFYWGAFVLSGDWR